MGGGPKTLSDDIALLVLSARDALHRGVLVGPYSRYGWHHPGPSYFYLLAVPVSWWHGPTGLYVTVPLIVGLSAAGLALLVRRGSGDGAGWVAAESGRRPCATRGTPTSCRSRPCCPSGRARSAPPVSRARSGGRQWRGPSPSR